MASAPDLAQYRFAPRLFFYMLSVLCVYVFRASDGLKPNPKPKPWFLKGPHVELNLLVDCKNSLAPSYDSIVLHHNTDIRSHIKSYRLECWSIDIIEIHLLNLIDTQRIKVLIIVKWIPFFLMELTAPSCVCRMIPSWEIVVESFIFSPQSSMFSN